MEKLSFIALGLLVFGIQGYLSSRKRVWLGAVIPFIYVIAVLVFFKRTGTSVFSWDIMPFSLFFTLLLGSWISGYEARKKKEKIELDKMKSQDLK